MSQLFENLDQAEAFENSKHFAEGRFIVRIEACKFRAGGHKGDSFIVETTVLGAIAEDGHVKQEDQTMAFVCYPRPGERASHVWGASGTAQRIEQGRGNWIAFMCAAFGCQKTDFTGPQWKSHSGQILDNNYLKGQVFALDCHVKRTQKDGPFTVHNWRGIATPEQCAEFGLAADGSVTAATPTHAAPQPPVPPAAAPAAAALAPAAAPAEAAAPAVAAIAATAAPMRGQAPDGRPTLSHDGGVNWVYA